MTLAQVPSNPQEVFGKIDVSGIPFFNKYHPGEEGLSLLITDLVSLAFTVSGIILLVMLVWGAFDWIIAGGDKGKIESARNKMIQAIVGFILLSVTFAVMDVIQIFTGFKIFYFPGT